MRTKICARKFMKSQAIFLVVKGESYYDYNITMHGDDYALLYCIYYASQLCTLL